MATPRISTVAAIAALDAIVDLLDVGGAGTINIYTGAIPATVETAASGTLLGTLTLSATAFGAAVDGTDKATATAAAITGDTTADNTGTAGYFRAFSGGAAAVIQGTVTATAGGGDLELDSVSVTAGDTINITSWVVNLSET